MRNLEFFSCKDDEINKENVVGSQSHGVMLSVSAKFKGLK